MLRTISVGELRQNPTEALDAVGDGETVTVLRNRRPIADLVPHVRQPGISGAEFMMRARLLIADDGWLDDLAAARTAEDRDHWA